MSAHKHLGSGGKKHRSIVWFRGTDLRVHDNEVLKRAVESATERDGDVVPFFTYDPRWFSKGQLGAMRKTGPFRAKYLIESVNDLRRNLKSLGSDLVIATGAPEDRIVELIPQGCSCTVFAQRDIHPEELDVEEAVRASVAPLGSSLELVWGSTLYHPDDISLHFDVQHVPTPATKFMKLLDDAGITVRAPLPTPPKGALGPIPDDIGVIDAMNTSINCVEDLGYDLQTPQDDPRRALKMPGGETAAKTRWQHYLDSHAVSTYFDTRNGMIGEDYSTKLSPALAHGCISPRYVSQQTRVYEAEYEANKSTSWIDFELKVRDYYKFYALTHGAAIFKAGGPVEKQHTWEDDPDGATFRRWKEGRTGWPLVDANMRELAATGYMSNRGRQNVASFLCHDLNLDWRLGAEYFEHMLSDYDVASNWGSWLAAAGLTGGRLNKFNIVKQSKQYDEHGDYIKLWLPELADEATDTIHDPRPHALESVYKYPLKK